MPKYLAADGLLKAPLKLIGAKTGGKKNSPRSQMYACIPEGTRIYIEPFLGSGGCLIGKPKHEIEIVNDTNRYVIAFYFALQNAPGYLLHEIEEYMRPGMTREYFDELRFKPPHKNDIIKTAAWFCVIVKHARNGILRFRVSDGKCNSTFGAATGRGVMTDPEWIIRLRHRIMNVKFWSSDYRIFLNNVVEPEWGEEAFIFLDPPYSRVFTNYDSAKFRDEDHDFLARWLSVCPARFYLTINDNAFVRELYSWANIREVNVHWQCSNTNKGRGPMPELVITNYDYTPPEEQ